MNKIINVRNVRIFTGLVLMFYLTSHFINHALGLISLDAMNKGGQIAKQFWHFPPISIILYGSLFAHFAITLWQFFQKRTIKIKIRDWLQLILGLAIPFLMLGHIMGTRYAWEAYEITASYNYVLLATFVWDSSSGIKNAAGVIVAWVHGCIGMHLWLQGKKIYTKLVQIYLLIVASILPCAALAGYLFAGRKVIGLSENKQWLESFNESLTVKSNDVWQYLIADINRVWYIIFFIIAATIILRLVRDIIAYKNKTITIQYLDGPKIRQAKNQTLLEMSKNANVPHANVCGGRGRCSTCRVKILKGETQNTISQSEEKVLARIGSPENVRLACQCIPKSDMEIMLLLPTDTTQAEALTQESWETGQEKVAAIMFADLREFTSTSENKLPFDVVYLINQFSRTMGKCVERHNGRIDKFLGDGLMAIFGIDSPPQQAAQDAINASFEMANELKQLNKKLKSSLEKPLRMGVGLHIGPVVLGRMGYGASRGLTAIGDTVNTASRLESETKNHQSFVCLSGEIVSQAKMELPKTLERQVKIRGKEAKFAIYAIDEENINAIMEK